MSNKTLTMGRTPIHVKHMSDLANWSGIRDKPTLVLNAGWETHARAIGGTPDEVLKLCHKEGIKVINQTGGKLMTGKWVDDEFKHGHRQDLPCCDGEGCTGIRGETRKFPLGPLGNMVLCKSCFNDVMKMHKKFNNNGMDLPIWDSFDEGELVK